MTKSTSLALPNGIPLDEWRRIGEHIFTVHDSSSWWLGDWLIYGQTQYPDRYKLAIAETGLDYQTLRNYAWVARQFSASRRREALSFQHHAEVASLSPTEQDEWLDRVERFKWSRNGLRNRLRTSKGARPAEGDAAEPYVQMDVPPDRRQRWLDAAAGDELDLLTWIVSTLDHAATALLEPPRDDAAG
ncbi:LmbU family transcriptional regulator [Actinosynnema sp. NPDC023587]|uniref:LmbU family transcriptional regulator n=1 Tax=Actinosynnema sp. NPDC023587 TaxID=3154695 RepID=UPI0033DE4527